MLYEKWKLVFELSFLCGIFPMLILTALWRGVSNMPLIAGSSVPSRNTFPTPWHWAGALGKSGLECLLNLIIYLLLTFAVGFAIVCVFTRGAPFR